MEETYEKLSVAQLVEEVAIALNDTFVAHIEQEDTSILLHFVGGKKFRLTMIEE